jgi:hypothetical protein
VATATMIARRLAGERRPTIYEADEEGMASLITAAESAGKIAIIGREDSRRRWVSAREIAALVASVAAEPTRPA